MRDVNKRKIWIYNDLALGGGAENVMLNIANYLAENGYSVTVTSDGTSAEEFSAAYSPKVNYYPRFLLHRSVKRRSFKWLLEGLWIKFYKKVMVPVLDNRRYHTRIAFKDGACTVKVAGMRGKRKISWVHTDYSTYHWTKPLFASQEEELACFARFDRVVCVSEACRQAMLDIVGDPQNLVVAYNPINVPEILEKAAERIDDTRDENLLFISVGRLVWIKQYDLLLSACKNLQDNFKFTVWIIGNGREYQKLKKRIEDEQIHSVRLLGEKKNPFPYLAKADCYICCSKSECHPLAVQEATVLGLPVICTSFPAAREVVPDGFGEIVENSVSGLQDALERVLQNPEQISLWKDTIRKQFHPDELWMPRIEKILQILE